MPSGHGLRGIVERLRGNDALERKTAMEQLRAMSRLGLGASDALCALQEAAGCFPNQADGANPAALLVRAAARVPRRLYIPVIEEQFARYDGPTKVEALRLLVLIGERKAADTYMALVGRYAAQGVLPGLASDALLEKAVQLDRYFPELLASVEQPQLALEVAELTVALCDEELLDPRCLRPRVASLLRAYLARREQLLMAERAPAGDQAARSGLARLRREATAMLELLGRVATPEAELELQLALGYLDPALKSVAVRALQRLDRHVAPEHLACLTQAPVPDAWPTARAAAHTALPGGPDTTGSLPLVEPLWASR